MEEITSQLSYLATRKTSYNKKYLMVKYLSQLLPKNLNVLELFGGVGIYSSIFNKYNKIKDCITLEIDANCIPYLINNKVNVSHQIINTDSFKYENNNNFDLLICDCNAFNKITQDKIIELINKFNFKYCMLTITSIFGVKFKGNNYEEYFNELKEYLHKSNLYIKNLIYTDSFSLAILVKEKPEKECIISIKDVFTKDEIKNYLEWKQYTILKKENKLF